MLDSAYTQKRIISAFIKALRMKLLPSAGTQFTLRSVSHIKYGTLRKRCCSSRLVFNNLAKLTKILTKKNQCNRFCFISIEVQAVLTFLVCLRNLRQYKKLPEDKFVKKKSISKNISQYAKLFLITIVQLTMQLVFQNYQCLPMLLYLIFYLIKWIRDSRMKKTIFC